ncbi:DNA replication/repair protein RecF [Pseudohaliea rubra]|uniref:DNA replication and repair protein RecF n=1 Tax=Pseudohaliea rubra DSM 19751 TaxID=1265313 RepID=A0A095X0K2_9GAMM|nr:DNA replication/repair protein RecF [Pseudohaliea rubra]KGE04429.1 DNA recombination and repair protein RecF [Pseudohaliea rubra DSM 19751]
MLTRVDIYNIRNLEAVRLHDLGRVCVLFGENGSGKTSVLEAIHMLSLARSFRASSARSVIRHGESHCTVYGEVSHGGGAVRALGVQRERSGMAMLKVAGRPVRNVSGLVAELPVLVINADSFQLLVGAPAARRRFLDWGVFHVEHEFFAAWQRFQRCIKQRNTLLRRDKLQTEELDAWTHDLALAGERLTMCRHRYFEQLVPVFHEVAEKLVPECGSLALRFRQGWDATLSYAEALKASTASDRDQGYTHVGPQRAEIIVTVDGHSAADTLSRGQQKLVVCALKLAQGYVLKQQDRSMTCAYLIDDLPSELDAGHTRRVCAQLEALGAQVFITCIAEDAIAGMWPAAAAPPQLFHVEQGQVTSVGRANPGAPAPSIADSENDA